MLNTILLNHYITSFHCILCLIIQQNLPEFKEMSDPPGFETRTFSESYVNNIATDALAPCLIRLVDSNCVRQLGPFFHKGWFQIYIQSECLEIIEKKHINALVQDCTNSSALAMELLQSCTKSSIMLVFPKIDSL